MAAFRQVTEVTLQGLLDERANCLCPVFRRALKVKKVEYGYIAVCFLHVHLQWYGQDAVLEEVIIAHNLAGICMRLDGTGMPRTIGGTFLHHLQTLSSKEANDYIFKGTYPDTA